MITNQFLRLWVRMTAISLNLNKEETMLNLPRTITSRLHQQLTTALTKNRGKHLKHCRSDIPLMRLIFMIQQIKKKEPEQNGNEWRALKYWKIYIKALITL